MIVKLQNAIKKIEGLETEYKGASENKMLKSTSEAYKRLAEGLRDALRILREVDEVAEIAALTKQLSAERRAVERLIEFGVRANHVDDRPCLAAPCTKNGVMPSCTDCLRDYAYADEKKEG